MHRKKLNLNSRFIFSLQFKNKARNNTSLFPQLQGQIRDEELLGDKATQINQEIFPSLPHANGSCCSKKHLLSVAFQNKIQLTNFILSCMNALVEGRVTLATNDALCTYCAGHKGGERASSRECH